MNIGINNALLVSAALALLWLALAAFNPTTTYHLAPLLVAVWPSLKERRRSRAFRTTLGGLTIALAATAVASAAGFLGGPSLLPWGGAATESVVAAAVGATIGLIPAIVAAETPQT